MSGLILVTGATGFLGRHLCQHLAAKGARVRGLVRSTAATLPAGIEVAVASDLLDRDRVREAMRGAAAVVHLAALVHVMRDRAEDPLEAFRRVNVEGTRIVMEEALRARVSAFIFVSSVKAVGDVSEDCWTDAVTPAPVDPYGLSKLEAERLVATLASGTTVRVTTLRLPVVYGPGMKGNMLRLFSLVDHGYPLPFGRIANRRALVYCGNVVAAIETAMTAMTVPPSKSRPFFVSDGDDLSTPALVRQIARALRRPARLVPIPPTLIRLLGRAGDVIARVVACPFTTADVDRLLGSLSLDTSRFTQVTGFRPPFDVVDGLAATAQWYRGMLPAEVHTPASEGNAHEAAE